MRRFVYEDKDNDVKVTVDMPEELHTRLHELDENRKEAIKKLANFTIDISKEEDNE